MLRRDWTGFICIHRHQLKKIQAYVPDLPKINDLQMMSLKVLMNMPSKIAQALQYVLTDKANELAKNGFIRRSRKITGSIAVAWRPLDHAQAMKDPWQTIPRAIHQALEPAGSALDRVERAMAMASSQSGQGLPDNQEAIGTVRIWPSLRQAKEA